MRSRASAARHRGRITNIFFSRRRCPPTPAVGALLCALVAQNACGSRPGTRSGSTLLRIGFGIGTTARSSGVESLTELLYSEPLIGRRVDGRPAPELAQSWSMEDGDRRVKVILKPGVRLHSGTLLTAETVAKSLNQQVAAARAAASGAFQTVTRISADGDGDAVVVDLTQPDALLLSELLGLRIVDPDAPDNGTGPFRVVKRKPQTETVRFDQYHGGVSGLGGVTIVTYDSQRSAGAALLRGEIDAVQEVSRESVEFLEGSSNIRTYSFMQPFYIPLVFNLRHPVLGKVEARRAITLALDRQAIVDQAMRGRGRVADGPIWPLHWAFVPATDRYAFDPKEAVRRLDREGVTLDKASHKDAPSVRFSFKCLFWSEDPQYERIALMIQRQLFAVGIDVQLEPTTLAELRTRVSTGRFDAFLMRTNASRSLDITYRFWRSTGETESAMQRSGYTGADEAFDALQRSTTDLDVRTAVASLAQRFYEDAPAAFIAWTEITRAVDSRFVVPDVGADDPFAKIWQWRPAGGEGRQ